MKIASLLGLLALACCTADSQMYEVSSTSSTSSKKDGVFLKSYRLSPATSYLPVKEVFVEQRFLEGGNPTHLRLLDSTKIMANLLIVCEKPVNLGLLSFDWNLVLADGGPLTDRRARVACSQQSPELLRFRLRGRPTFGNPTFPVQLQLMKDSATNVVKTINLLATPL